MESRAPLPPSRSRSFTRTNRYTGNRLTPSPPPHLQAQHTIHQGGTTEEVSPVSPVSPESPIPGPARPSFSAFDEIHLESPRELKPLGLGLTNTTRPTSETFRENFNRFNNIPPGGGLGNLGNMRRSGSQSSTSSRASSRSGRSSVSTTGQIPEKPPAYVATREVEPTEVKVEGEQAKKQIKSNWCSLSKWSPLMWIQMLFFLGFPTLTLAWSVSLIYFTLLPRLFPSKGKALDDWVLQSVERANTVATQEGIALEGTECTETRRKMRRWEVATAGAAGVVWTLLCVAFGIIAVETARRNAKGHEYGSGNVVGEF